ncbi:hypothetical protein Hanom_Chr14g01247501 [Helianthus anomalus]
MSFSSLKFGQFCDFRLKVCFSSSGSKRFKILPFSSGSLTFFSVKSGVFRLFYLLFFCFLFKKKDILNTCTLC